MSESTVRPLVSVIIPAYGHEKFIKQALDSVANQTYSAIELIVLDDCSKDDTLAVAQRWASIRKAEERFSRVLIEQNPENLGAHQTINRGISLAKGDFITILNSDDYFAQDRIEMLVEAALRQNAQLLFSAVRVIGENGERIVSTGLPSEIESMPDFAQAQPSLSIALLFKNVAVSTGNLFFSRKLIEQIGDFRPLRYCHDWDFVLRASLITEPVLLLRPLYYYRIHGSNSFAALKVEQYLETQLIYRHYFMSCRAGNCINQQAPWGANWPGIFDKLVPEDQNLSWSYHLVGNEHVKLDHLARMVHYMSSEG